MEDKFYKKYLKYKSKYLSLKNLMGGMMKQRLKIIVNSKRPREEPEQQQSQQQQSQQQQLQPENPKGKTNIEEYISLYSDNTTSNIFEFFGYKNEDDLYELHNNIIGYLNSYFKILNLNEKDYKSILNKDNDKFKILIPYLSDHRPIWDLSLNCISWNVCENEDRYQSLLMNISYDTYRRDLIEFKASVIVEHLKYIIEKKLGKRKKLRVSDYTPIIINLQECNGELSTEIFNKMKSFINQKKLHLYYDWLPENLIKIRDSPSVFSSERKSKSEIYSIGPQSSPRNETGFATFLVTEREEITLQLLPCLLRFISKKDESHITDWAHLLYCRGCLVTIKEENSFEVFDDKAIFNLNFLNHEKNYYDRKKENDKINITYLIENFTLEEIYKFLFTIDKNLFPPNEFEKFIAIILRVTNDTNNIYRNRLGVNKNETAIISFLNYKAFISGEYKIVGSGSTNKTTDILLDDFKDQNRATNNIYLKANVKKFNVRSTKSGDFEGNDNTDLFFHTLTLYESLA